MEMGQEEENEYGINNHSRLFLESFSARDSDLLDDKDLLELQNQKSEIEDINHDSASAGQNYG